MPRDAEDSATAVTYSCGQPCNISPPPTTPTLLLIPLILPLILLLQLLLLLRLSLNKAEQKA
jgi:hypothetical protein